MTAMPPDGDSQPPVRGVRVLFEGGRTFEVRREDVFVPGGTIVDVTVFRVTTAYTTLVPRAIVYDPPLPDDVFLVSGFDKNGAHASVPQHMRFEATLLAAGDRDASGLHGCVGAPAISQKGVFGIVSECDANRSPVIALLSMSRSFIERHMPRPTTQTSLVPQFDVVDRQTTGPLVLVACDVTKTGELEVPLNRGPWTWAVAAKAAFLNPSEVRLADVACAEARRPVGTVAFYTGRSPVTPGPPVSCPQGPALVTLHVNVAVVRTPE